VKLSANWMAACGEPGEDAALYDTVRAVGLHLCPALNVGIPVGKDSLSMRTRWTDEAGAAQQVTAPVSLIVTAFAALDDVRATLTPQLQNIQGEDTTLILIDLGRGQRRMGGSILAQTVNQFGDTVPDLDDPALLVRFFEATRELLREGLILSYHDRSDGGLCVTLAEMAFAGGFGLTVELAELGSDPVAALFSEELGAVLEVPSERSEEALGILARHGLARGPGAYCHLIGAPGPSTHLVFRYLGQDFYFGARAALRRRWSETSFQMQARRDNADCARQEFELASDADDLGLRPQLSFDLEERVEAPPYIALVSEPPRVAILREQGVNGQVEMAAAFTRVGFAAVDVHMSDLLGGRIDLTSFKGLAACGGFSYGDVLGAGQGWAKSILYSARGREAFREFFARSDSFALGVCNGCQMLSALKELIPGAEAWPRFLRNTSEQFEARLSLVEVQPSSSILFSGMTGSRLPVVVSHGEGRAAFATDGERVACEERGLVALRFIDSHGRPTEHYPENPNGSPTGITALTTPDGRVTALMPHPERVFRSVQLSWRPENWGERSPWLRLFANARRWVG
jgi:phosphoribosylformylglycinamidine synthase